MNTQTEMVANPTEQQSAGAVLDLLRTIFHLKISRYHIKMVLQSNPLFINAYLLSTADEALFALVKEIKYKVPQVIGAEWLEADMSSDKLFMGAVLIESIARIGVEQNEHYYEEFCDLVVSLLDEIFYCQQHRKRIHFSKYKALMELIRSELRADVNHGSEQQGQIIFKDKAIWFRANPLVPVPSEIQS